MDERVTRLKTPEECENFIRNVKERLPDLALAARRRAIQLRADAQAVARGITTAVEREALEAVYAYESAKSQKTGKKTTASRTWRMIERHGIIEAVERLVTRPSETEGYTALVEMSMEQFAFEAVVLRHPEVFSQEAVTRSTNRLRGANTVFVVGRQYTRRDVQEILSVPEERRGGNWDTGYTSYDGSIYVFCNVGTPGRTGHDYPNLWVADTLQWSAKNGSRVQQPSTRELIGGGMPVHIFWRHEDRNPFYYAGAGRATAVVDESPVRLTWQFDSRAEWRPERPAEEVPETGTYPEGALKRVSVNAYERNPYARARCIEHYGATCQACGFDFKSAYGDIGAGFIHVHHLLDLAEVGGEYAVDPIKDLRPVCPNCHAMLHRRRPAYTLLELSAWVRKNSASGT